MTTATLTLDADSLPIEELSMPALMRELNLQQRPNWLLCKLMNALEQKRQAKGLGWSRAWNKYGLNVFRTHVHDREKDAAYLGASLPLLHRLLTLAPAAYRDFATELLADPALLMFTFYHNHEGPEGQHEGLTLSFGRKVAVNPSKRDRLDLILEDRRLDGRVDGLLDRVRLYVCPWSEYQHGKTHVAIIQPDPVGEVLLPAQALYENCVRHYHEWKGDDARQWSHWSARYIEYFGPRSFIPIGSSFA